MPRLPAVPLLVASQTSSKLADVLSNAKTVLTWLVTALGAPAWITSLLVPVRESGSMLPQLWLAAAVKRFRRRKWAYSAGAAGQTAGAVIMAGAALTLSGAPAGLTILGGLTLLALSRAVCSIAGKDVLGRLVDKGDRGRVGGLSASISGAVGGAAAVAAVFTLGERSSIPDYAAVVAGAAALFLLAGVGYSLLPEERETVEENETSRPSVRELWADATFRNFVLARGLLLGSALGSPYIVMFAQGENGDLKALALFMVAGAVASAISSLAWGSLADRSAKHTMAAGGFIATVVGAAAVRLSMAGVPAEQMQMVWPLVYFLFALGYNGVRMGRKTYVVDIAAGDRRTDYVAVSNTLMAGLLLAMGAVGAALSNVSAATALAGYLVITAAGSLYALQLEDAES